LPFLPAWKNWSSACALTEPPTHAAEPFAAEEAERTAYRVELDRLREYVSMGEGI